MTAAPWSVKGIEPKAREIAKDLARRSGMTLGEWLNGMILDDDGRAGSPSMVTSRDEDEDEADDPKQRRGSFRPAPDVSYRGKGEPERPRPVDSGPIAGALERLSTRIEASETRSANSINAIEYALREALGRFDHSEREREGVTKRIDSALRDLQVDQSRLADRVRSLKAERDEPKATEAVKSLEAAMSKMAAYVYEGEGATRKTLGGIDARLAKLEGDLVDRTAADPRLDAVIGRLDAAETRTTESLRDLGLSMMFLEDRLDEAGLSVGHSIDQRLATLTQDLEARIEKVRQDMSDQIRSIADGRLDHIDSLLTDMTERVQAAESKAAQAIETMGREVLDLAEGLGRRMQAVETRTSDVLQQVGADVVRLGKTLDQRLAHSDRVQTSAVQALATEVGRTASTVFQRVEACEQRNAQAIDEVGAQVARVADHIAERHDRATTELSARVRQSEELTISVLDEVRERIDASMEANQRRMDAQLAAFSQAQIPAPTAADPVLPELDGVATPPIKLKDPEPEPQGETRSPTERRTGGHQPFRGLFQSADATESLFSDPLSPMAEPEAPPWRARTARDVVDEARSASLARESLEDGKRRRARRKPGGGARPFDTRDNGPSYSGGATLHSLFIAAGAMATMGLGLAGYMVLYATPTGKVPDRVAQAVEVAHSDRVAKLDGASVPPDGNGFASVALSPTLINPASKPAVGSALAVSDADLESLYRDSVRQIEAKDGKGLTGLRRAANLGFGPAQFYMAKLYENGAGGVKRDLAEARRWTERAAMSGDRKAMHNMALYAFEGAGGVKNATVAAQWFRKAADLGLVDSQYNLGRLYEEGIGVSQNLAEAYKWYLVAARAGDPESRSSAQRVRASLSYDAEAAAQRAAQGFKATAPDNTGEGSAANELQTASLATAQRALSKLGYYQGPADGTTSPALQLAISAWQKDQGLLPSGRIDTESLARLSTFAR